MPIADPLRSPIYGSGELIQQCDACTWAQRGHRRELAACPECGAPLGHPLAIAFGGTALIYRGKDFHIYSNDGSWLSLQEADLPDSLQFMCRHALDWRSADERRDDGRVRRVTWQTYFDKHLFGRE